jgi:hypothetical protein
MLAQVRGEVERLTGGGRIVPQLERCDIAASSQQRGEPSVLKLLGIALAAWFGLIATATLLFG